MEFKVRKLYAKYYVGVGIDSPISGVLIWGKRIKAIDKIIVDGTEWIKFIKGKKFVWVKIDDLKVYRH